MVYRGRDPIILECARSLWMMQALFDIEISYVHISGEENIIADSLSRLHLNPYYYDRAIKASSRGYLVLVLPRTHIFHVLYPSLVSKSGIPVVTAQSDGPPA